ncbi:hypothetical protein SHKM778_91510 [Streptomyces sp. KM77-8]|uniref:Transposase n=1 Tax=Streptomyces haneummycinicus TaxID=3074435 RepID=A0AAT9HZE7_9ACTN
MRERIAMPSSAVRAKPQTAGPMAASQAASGWRRAPGISGRTTISAAGTSRFSGWCTDRLNTGMSWARCAWRMAPDQLLSRAKGAVARSTAMGWRRRHRSGTVKPRLRVISSQSGTSRFWATLRQPLLA